MTSAPKSAAPPLTITEDELWAKVGQAKVRRHRKGGDAEDSKFVLLDPRKVRARPATRP
ncbi:MAG: hypothetical protein U0792_23260 [Gemmataceae bacterium]